MECTSKMYPDVFSTLIICPTQQLVKMIIIKDLKESVVEVHQRNIDQVCNKENEGALHFHQVNSM